MSKTIFRLPPPLKCDLITNRICCSNTFNRVNAISLQVWKFQRYSLVLEYESKPMLPPPFIILSHLYLIIKFISLRCQNDYFDNGLST